MNKLIFTKELEGKTIYLIGTGNNARRSFKNKIYEAKVIKVARVNVTLLFKDTLSERKLRKHCNQGSYSNYLDAGCNSGYACYYSEQDILDERKTQENFNKIKDMAFSTFSQCKLTLEQTEAILDILENRQEK